MLQILNNPDSFIVFTMGSLFVIAGGLFILKESINLKFMERTIKNLRSR